MRALLLLPLLFLTACGGSAGPLPEGARPNVLLIVVDTLRPDHLGCYGYPRPTSPHLDELARAGFVFERAQSTAPWTAPALVSLMTGLHPDAHGVASFPEPPRLAEGATTLAELLRARGYATAAFTGGGYAKGDFGLDQGFEHYERQQGDDESHASNLRFPSRLAANVDKSIDWLRNHAEQPFLLFFHTYEPHVPYYPAQRWLDAVGSGIDLAAEEAALKEAVATWNAGAQLSDEEWLLVARHRHHCGLVEAEPIARRAELEERIAARGLDRPRDEASPLVPFIADLYDAEIRAADAQLARLLEELDALGLADDTIVLLASDHGESLGEHGELGHGLLLSDVVLSMVLVLRAPMLALEPRRVAEVVSSVDVLPTLVELLGIERELELPGQSLLPAMRGESETGRAFSHSNTGVELRGRFHAVREGRWRYVAQTDGAGRWLYDLETDPGERRDVRREHPEVAARLEDALRERLAADAARRAELPPTPLEGRAPDPDLEKLGYTGRDEQR